jgi:hypothetical protein
MCCIHFVFFGFTLAIWFNSVNNEMYYDKCLYLALVNHVCSVGFFLIAGIYMYKYRHGTTHFNQLEFASWLMILLPPIYLFYKWLDDGKCECLHSYSGFKPWIWFLVGYYIVCIIATIVCFIQIQTGKRAILKDVYEYDSFYDSQNNPYNP